MKRVGFAFIFILMLSLNLFGDKVYVVAKGDTIYSISKKHGTSIDQIKQWNRLKTSKITIGQKLIVKKETSQVADKNDFKSFKYYKVKPKETLWRIAYNHGIPVKTLIELNNINNVAGIKVGQTIKVPSNAVAGKTTGAGLPVYGKLRLQRPVPGTIYPSENKNGINIVCSASESVRAVLDGSVEYTGSLVGYRNVVIVNHGKDLYSIYAALGPVHVEKGQSVRKGQVVGNVEKLAHYEKPFLYLELVSGGTYLNPAKYIY